MWNNTTVIDSKTFCYKNQIYFYVVLFCKQYSPGARNVLLHPEIGALKKSLQRLKDKVSLAWDGLLVVLKKGEDDRGIRVYTRSAMGISGCQTALEEMMCRVLSDVIEKALWAKIAVLLYYEALLNNWRRVFQVLDRCNLRLSPTKTVVRPKITSILGWIWSQGRYDTRIVLLPWHRPLFLQLWKKLRSFIGAYKVLSHVLPNC